MEKQIIESGSTFKCFKCKKELEIKTLKCPKCGLVTYFGITNKKKKGYFILIAIYLFAAFNLWRKNQGLF